MGCAWAHNPKVAGSNPARDLNPRQKESGTLTAERSVGHGLAELSALTRLRLAT